MSFVGALVKAWQPRVLGQGQHPAQRPSLMGDLGPRRGFCICPGRDSETALSLRLRAVTQTTFLKSISVFSGTLLPHIAETTIL